METTQNEQVIYLKDLLFSALYQWKKILLYGIVLAVLLGGIKGGVAFKNMKDEETQRENAAQQELELELYEGRKISLQQQIDSNRANARRQQTYLDESVLMNMDAYNYYEVYLSCFLETDYQIVPGMSYQNPDPTNAIIQAYADGITNDTNSQLLAEALGTKPEYLQELLTLLTISEAQSFSVLFKVQDQASAEKLLECLTSVIGQLQEEITGVVAKHEANIKESYVRQSIDPELMQRQQEEADKLTKLNDLITELQQQKNDLRPTKVEVASAASVVKDAVIFAVIGGVLGVMLVVLWAWMKHIFGAVVYSCRSLVNRTGIKVFGCVKSQTKVNPVDAWLKAKEGRNNLPADKQNAMLAYSVAAAMGNEGTLQLCGCCGEQERAAFAAAMGQISSQIRVCDAGSLLADVSARQALNQTDCVLLLEQCGVSTYEEVSQQIQVVAEHGKKLLGCVLLDG